MGNLLLLRHGKSSMPAGMKDHARPLDPLGKAHMQALGEMWRQKTSGEFEEWTNQVPMPEKVLCSTALRTRETLDCLRFDHAPPVVFLDGLYLCDGPYRLWQLIYDESESESAEVVLCVAHNPVIHQLALALALQGPQQGPQEDIARLQKSFPPGSLCALSVPWTPELPSGELNLFIRPGDDK